MKEIALHIYSDPKGPEFPEWLWNFEYDFMYDEAVKICDRFKDYYSEKLLSGGIPVDTDAFQADFKKWVSKNVKSLFYVPKSLEFTADGKPSFRLRCTQLRVVFGFKVRD